MSWAGRRTYATRPQTLADREFLRRRVENGFYYGRKDTAQLAQETGYDESVIARVLHEVREDRYAKRVSPVSPGQ